MDNMWEVTITAELLVNVVVWEVTITAELLVNVVVRNAAVPKQQVAILLCFYCIVLIK